MDSAFKLKAKRMEEMLSPSSPKAEPVSVGTIPEEPLPAWLRDYVSKGVLPQVPALVPQAAPYHDCVALMVMKADATSKDATWGEALVDHTVQFGQPYPAVTHVELWIGDRPTESGEDNHFSTYLGAKKGALWTSGMTDSKKFYSSPAWSAIPIFASDVERRIQKIMEEKDKNTDQHKTVQLALGKQVLSPNPRRGCSAIRRRPMRDMYAPVKLDLMPSL